MAAEETGTLSGTRRGLAGLLFLAGATNAYDAFSAFMSSPWAANQFGGDPAKAESTRRYIRHALVVTGFYGLAASLLADNWFPLAGTLLVDGYMYYLYEDALARAARAGATEFGS